MTFIYSTVNLPDISSFFLVGNLGPENGMPTNITLIFGSPTSQTRTNATLNLESFESLEHLVEYSPLALSEDGVATVAIFWEPSESPIELTVPYWKYESGLPLNVIIGIAAGGGILLVAIIVIVIIVIIRKYLDKRMEKKSTGQ